MAVSLILDVENGKTITIGENTLLVFIDETGDQLLKDKNFPVFGLGVCAIPSNHYSQIIDSPWRELRRKILGNEEKTLHASELELEKIPKEYIANLAEFFVIQPFKRFATIISEKTILTGNYEVYQICASVISKRITELSLQNPHLLDVALIFESSTSGNKLLSKYFRDVDFKNHGLKSKINRFVASKGVTTGLDVADFIIQAAGAQTRNRIKGNKKFRKDFESVFKKCKPEHHYFLEITRVEEPDK